MPESPLRLYLFAAASLATVFSVTSALAKVPDDFVGTWILSSGKAGAKCRVLFRAQKSDKGDFFLGMPAACRHSMPSIASAGRWGAPDETHLTLDNPAGTSVLSFTGAGGAFLAMSEDDTFTLQKIDEAGRTVAGSTATGSTVPTSSADESATAGPETVKPVAASTKKAKAAALDSETIATIPGRYAIMRDKRDTGCMLTLDKTRSKGSDRAQLAPGCRDQGIVVFDPASWQLNKGEMVLTARAGHKVRLMPDGEGSWKKDAVSGAKPLGLKKL